MADDRRRLFSHHEDGVQHLSINVRKWRGVLGFFRYKASLDYSLVNP